MKRVCSICYWLCLASTWLANSCIADVAAIEQFRADYAKQGIASETTFNNWSGKFDYEEKSWADPADKSKRSEFLEFASNGRLKKLITHHAADLKRKLPQRDQILILDEQQSYLIGKEAKAAEYLLKSVKPRKPGTTSLGDGIERILGAPCSLVDRRISKILSKATTRIDSVKAIDFDGRSMVEVELRFGSEAQSLATIVFDPALGFRIRRSEVQLGDLNNVKIISTVQYRIDEGGQVVLKSIECRDLDGKLKTATFRSVSFLPPPREEFSPKFYGLPDLAEKPNQAGARGYVGWLIGGALACFGGGIVFWLLSRRSR